MAISPYSPQNPKYWQDSKDGDTIYMSAYYSADQSWVDKTLQAIKTWYVDKEILGYINNEITKRHVIKSLQKEEQNIEI
jgi:hypothetical protein